MPLPSPRRLFRTARPAAPRRRAAPADRAAVACESLEARRLLTGRVSAKVRGGDLVIRGDGKDNGVSVERAGSRTAYVVRGVDAGGRPTTVNGERRVTLRGVRGDVRVNLRGGDDSVRIGGDRAITVRGRLDLRGGGGNDRLTVSGAVAVDGRAKVLGGSGNDSVSFFGTAFGDSVRVSAGGGNDSVFFSGAAVERGVRAVLGRGNDSLTVSGSTLNFGLVADGRAGGRNAVTVLNGLVGPVVAFGGGGADQLVVNGATVSSLTVKTGAGRDGVLLDGATLFRDAFVDLGGGTDFLRVRGSGLNGDLRATGGPGGGDLLALDLNSTVRGEYVRTAFETIDFG